MAKCVTGICVYDDTKLYKFMVSRVDFPDVILYDNRDGEKFETFYALYDRLLKLLKENHFYTKTTCAYNRMFYDIVFIDYNNPANVNHYGYRYDPNLPYDGILYTRSRTPVYTW